MTLPLSISIVCRDSEPTIGRTLDSVAGLASEIVAVDSGSTDGTIDLLKRHGARVIKTDWKGYVATKQMALEACTQEWVLALDSDESLLPELRCGIESVLNGRSEAHGYRVNRQVWYRGRPLEYAWQPEWRLRLVRREIAHWTGLDPHDHLVLRSGRTADLPGKLRHDSIGSFADFLVKQARHASLMAESMRAEGERGSLLSLLTSPPGAFVKQLILKQGWRDGVPGWLCAASAACGAMMKHAVLLELTRGMKEEAGQSDRPPAGEMPGDRAAGGEPS